MDGNVSQICYLGFSFQFMETRKISFRKIISQNVSRFCALIKLGPESKIRGIVPFIISFARHLRSLKRLIEIISEIMLVQNIKVKKILLNLHFRE